MKTRISVRSICQELESWAPSAWAYEWDKAGLAVGDPNANVASLLICLTVTRAVYEAARAAKANMVVSHHPLIWEPLSALRFDFPATRLCLDFAQTGIACYSAHTNLDVAPGGVNEVLAERLGLQDLKPLLKVKHASQVKLVTFVPESYVKRVREAVSEAGAGVIGQYTHCSFSAAGIGSFKPGDGTRPFSGEPGRVNEEPEHRFETVVQKARLPYALEALFKAHPYEEVAYDIIALENLDSGISLGIRGILAKPLSAKAFAANVRKCLGLDHVRLVGESDKRIQRVAVIGGGGGGEIGKIPPDIDAYVTGDVKYHDACAALQRRLVVVDAGHAGTEQCIVPVMAERLRRRFGTLHVTEYFEPPVFRMV